MSELESQILDNARKSGRPVQDVINALKWHAELKTYCLHNFSVGNKTLDTTELNNCFRKAKQTYSIYESLTNNLI